MFSGSFLLVLLANLAYVFIGIAVVWLVIYSAVRAALASHRQATARERRPGPE
ncbi:hypothetical protein ABTZ44_16275 [Microbacterium oxydans]|jgi:uncharacterized membrane protein YuzA (DUF378 family)|uniref:hypothetical protein n=1 Tax=Microbacterium TaxID=33882 RepID=UPI000B288B3D|nr:MULTISPECIES: hypothetical protein [Microbacterium]MBE7955350.1 hypothetical protein [Microbacterium sp. R1]